MHKLVIVFFAIVFAIAANFAVAWIGMYCYNHGLASPFGWQKVTYTQALLCLVLLIIVSRFFKSDSSDE